MTVRQNIVLIGFMGTGKSSVARCLAETKGLTAYETDSLIEKKANKPVPAIFESFGEEYFRRLETEVIAELSGVEGAVVSCGGGAALRGENVELMKRIGIIALLCASPETVYERVKAGKNRPLLNTAMSVEGIAALMEKRMALYQAAADITISTDGKTIRQICAELLGRL